MAVTISGSSGITYPDSSTQASAAGTAFGSVGSYVIAGTTVLAQGADAGYAAGSTFAGSTLEYNTNRGTGYSQPFGASAVSPQISYAFTRASYGLSGTWRVMHFIRGTDYTASPLGLFLRIS